MSDPRPPEPQSAPFHVGEDDLVRAIFYDSSLGQTTGSGTKAEARLQAKAMIAGPKLLAACEDLLANLKELVELSTAMGRQAERPCITVAKTAIAAARGVIDEARGVPGDGDDNVPAYPCPACKGTLNGVIDRDGICTACGHREAGA